MQDLLRKVRFDQRRVLSSIVDEKGNLSVNMSEITITCFADKDDMKMEVSSSKKGEKTTQLGKTGCRS